MFDFSIIVWLFLIVFMLHEFEEIIFLKPWVGKNSAYLSKRFPKFVYFTPKVYQYFNPKVYHFNLISKSVSLLGAVPPPTGKRTF